MRRGLKRKLLHHREDGVSSERIRPDAKGTETDILGRADLLEPRPERIRPDAKGTETTAATTTRRAPTPLREFAPMRRGLKQEGVNPLLHGIFPERIRPDAKGTETLWRRVNPWKMNSLREFAPMRRGLKLA